MRMKSTRSTLGKLTLCALLSGTLLTTMMPVQVADAQGLEYPANTILTQGVGEVKVRPDSLSVSVSVESQADTLEQARRDNNQKMDLVQKAIRALEIPNLKMETRGYSVYPVHGEIQRNRLPRVVGYRVSNNLYVTVTKAQPDALGEYASQIVDISLNHGANQVGGLNFYLDDMTQARAQALKEAVADARQNAQALAQAAGVTITGVYSIEGTPAYGNGPRPYAVMSMRAADMAESVPPVPIETGETTITSRVTVRYQF